MEEQKHGRGFTKESWLEFLGVSGKSAGLIPAVSVVVTLPHHTQSPSNPPPAQAVLTSRNIGKGNKPEQAQHTLPATHSFHAPSQMLVFSCSLKSHAGPFVWIGLITAGAHQQSGIPEDPARSCLALQPHYLHGSAYFSS